MLLYNINLTVTRCLILVLKVMYVYVIKCVFMILADG